MAEEVSAIFNLRRPNMTAINVGSTHTASSPSPTAIGIGALTVASVMATVGFACAVPLAAFAAIAAMSFDRRDALARLIQRWRDYRLASVA
jgi:hypothetical protein